MNTDDAAPGGPLWVTWTLGVCAIRSPTMVVWRASISRFVRTVTDAPTFSALTGARVATVISSTSVADASVAKS